MDLKMNYVKEKKNIKMSVKDKIITLTYGDCAENHVGMQQLGEKEDRGFSLDELKKLCVKMKKNGANCEIIILNDYLSDELKKKVDYIGVVLILRNGIDFLFGEEGIKERMYVEQNSLEWNKKYWDNRRKKVLNKIKRWNLCYDNFEQKSDLENGKGSVVHFDRVPLTKKLRELIGGMLGKSGENLRCEGNNYYDIKSGKCGIGWHGDKERSKVVGVRLGVSGSLCYVWCNDGEEVSDRIKINLEGGDIYVMSEKSVGNDWLSRKKITLRHGMETVEGKILKKITKKKKKDENHVDFILEMLKKESLEDVRDFYKNIEDEDKVNNMSKEEIIKEYKHLFSKV